jgi:hypothetical protein
MPVAEDRIRRILGVLDTVEEQLLDALPRLAAVKLDELEIRQDETNQLEKEYVRWACRLADIFGVPIYPYSTRFAGRVGAVSAGCIPRN